MSVQRTTSQEGNRSLDAANDLLRFIDASPTPFHAAAEIASRLEAAGFRALDERERWALTPGARHYVVRGETTVIAFVVGTEPPSDAGFRMIGAHTDSPNLRVKPRPDVVRSGYRQVGVEIYGGVLLSTWLDRDLALAGRVVLKRSQGFVSRSVFWREAVARVPNLAIHLNRGVNSDGLVLNTQKHLVPVLGLGAESDLVRDLAKSLGEDKADIVGFDLGFADAAPSTLGGSEGEFVFAPRLDNLGSSHAALSALIAVASTARPATRLIVLHDHEECGSRSRVGAQGTVLKDTLTRITLGYGAAEHDAMPRAMSRSFLVSADMAHAVHPNYADQHEPQHTPKLNEGLVIKLNANQSYASDGASSARFRAACLEAGYTAQDFVVRTDLPCGSTIGSITAAVLGVETVDVGAPMLSMHSCREMAGSADVAKSIAAFSASLND